MNTGVVITAAQSSCHSITERRTSQIKTSARLFVELEAGSPPAASLGSNVLNG